MNKNNVDEVNEIVPGNAKVPPKLGKENLSRQKGTMTLVGRESDVLIEFVNGAPVVGNEPTCEGIERGYIPA